MTQEPRAPVQTYEKLASMYDEVRFVGPHNRVKEEFRTSALLRLLPSFADRVLDVACGTGRGLMLLTPRTRVAVGIDGTYEMLAEARKKLVADRGPVRICQGNAASLPFADRSFDAVTCLNFLHLFEVASMKQAFIAEIARVLRPGGTAVIEFDNAMHGLFLGPLRKYLGNDIGFEWPWALKGYFCESLEIRRVLGTNVPWIWRVPALRFVERMASTFPGNYLGHRLLIQVRKR